MEELNELVDVEQVVDIHFHYNKPDNHLHDYLDVHLYLDYFHDIVVDRHHMNYRIDHRVVLLFVDDNNYLILFDYNFYFHHEIVHLDLHFQFLVYVAIVHLVVVVVHLVVDFLLMMKVDHLYLN